MGFYRSYNYRNKVSGRFAWLDVMSNGTALVSMDNRNARWFPCYQEAASWLAERSYRQLV